MKAISISNRAKSINDLLKKARRRSIVLETKDGQRYVLRPVGEWEGFDVGNSDDFGEEVKRTVRNKRLMNLLSERRKTSKGKSKLLEEVEKELGLK
jgi:hypothetical protein